MAGASAPRCCAQRAADPTSSVGAGSDASERALPMLLRHSALAAAIMAATRCMSWPRGGRGAAILDAAASDAQQPAHSSQQQQQGHSHRQQAASSQPGTRHAETIMMC
jgi:hypothetical protein